MQKLIYTVGLPASGKDTWAIKKIGQNTNRIKRVNKDLLREMLDDSKWSKGNEAFILKMRDLIIEEALCDGYDVICTDTNFAPKHKERFHEIANELKKLGHDIKVEEQFFDVDPDTCIERDLKRQKSVGQKVIMGMYDRYLRKPTNTSLRNIDNFNPKLPKAIICDLDGTLCLYNDLGLKARHYDRDFINDKPNRVVLDLLDRYRDDHVLIIFSGRNGKHEKETKEWLTKHGINYKVFAMRKEGDNRKDTDVKSEMFDSFVKDKYNISFVCDDRDCMVKMWKEMGLFVMDVGRGIVF